MDSYLLTYLLTFSKHKSGKNSENKKKRRIVAGKVGCLFEGGALSSNYSK